MSTASAKLRATLLAAVVNLALLLGVNALAVADAPAPQVAATAGTAHS